MNRRTKSVDSEKLKSLLKDYSSALSKAAIGNYIFRGVPDTKSVKQWYLAKPSTQRRKSANTNEIYNTMIDFLPSWEDWPKRSRSLICSNNAGDASNFGEFLCLVLPKNGSRVCQASDSDFWGSFPYLKKRTGIEMMDDFNSYMELLFGATGNGKAAYSSEYYDSNKVIEMFDSLVSTDDTTLFDNLNRNLDGSSYHLRTHKMMETFIKDIKKYKRNWMTYFSDLLDPVKNLCLMVTIEKYFASPKPREIWTDGDCLLYRFPDEIVHQEIKPEIDHVLSTIHSL